MPSIEIFLIFLRLGLTSFGGPVAHLSYFHSEFVIKRKWFDEAMYAELVALCQFLPGPASSQVGLCIGYSRAGAIGALAAWVGFTLPSAALMTAFAVGFSKLDSSFAHSLVHGLKVVAVAIVAQAIWMMASRLCTDRLRATLAIATSAAVTVLPYRFVPIACLACASLFGFLLIQGPTPAFRAARLRTISLRSGTYLLAMFAAILFLLSFFADQIPNLNGQLLARFFRVGSLVFGGGHVVLPLLKSEVVNTGLVSQNIFLAGYGFAQAMPGPLFSFAAYLGAVVKDQPNAYIGASICLVAIFLPSFFLVFGVLPFWDRLRANRAAQNALAGINAAVVGLLIAVFYDPIWKSGILAPIDFAFALIAFFALLFWKTAPWKVVLAGALFGYLTSLH